MTQARSPEKLPAGWSGEPLWNVSLLPLPGRQNAAAPAAPVVVELPPDLIAPNATRSLRPRNAA